MKSGNIYEFAYPEGERTVERASQRVRHAFDVSGNFGLESDFREARNRSRSQLAERVEE